LRPNSLSLAHLRSAEPISLTSCWYVLRGAATTAQLLEGAPDLLAVHDLEQALAAFVLVEKLTGLDDQLLQEPGLVLDTPSFERLAWLAVSRQEPMRAALLLGGAQGLLEGVGASLGSTERRLRDEAVTNVRAQLGEERWSATFGEGRDMGLGSHPGGRRFEPG
jgi:hypothetical protein